MANITGTNGNDTLTTTVADDIIKGLGGNDTIISSGGFGSDSIDGGAGNDTVDYSSTDPRSILSLDLESNGEFTLKRPIFDNNSIFLGVATDKIVNIEKIILKRKGMGLNSSAQAVDFSNAKKINADLSKNYITYSLASVGTKTITIDNALNDTFFFSGSRGNDLIKGSDANDFIEGNSGNDVIVGSKGNDFLSGNNRRMSNGIPPVLEPIKDFDTLDYSNLDRAVKVSFAGGDTLAQDLIPFSTVDKSGLGVDTVGEFQKFIGATNKENILDASSLGTKFRNDQKLDVNLENNSFKISYIPSGQFSVLTTQKFKVFNFLNVIGGQANDKIIGSSKNSKLTGGGGSDIVTGCNGNDIITGSDSTARGVGEVDTLTGGGGRDKFILGDKNGAYYVGNGNNDYALITDFDLFKDSISIGSLKNYSFALEGTNTIDLYSGKDVNTRDLIAKIQLAGGISSVNSNARSVMGADASLNAIVAKLEIESES
jgi:Ca2+-binding RTX toxin-like protein